MMGADEDGGEEDASLERAMTAKVGGTLHTFSKAKDFEKVFLPFAAPFFFFPWGLQLAGMFYTTAAAATMAFGLPFAPFVPGFGMGMYPGMLPGAAGDTNGDGTLGGSESPGVHNPMGMIPGATTGGAGSIDWGKMYWGWLWWLNWMTMLSLFWQGSWCAAAAAQFGAIRRNYVTACSPPLPHV